MSHVAALSAVTFSPDGRTLYSGGADGAIHEWDVLSGAHRRALEGHDRSVLDLAVTSDGRELFSASRDGTICVWCTATGSLDRVERRHRAGVYALSIGSRGLSSASHDGTAKTPLATLRGHDAAVTGALWFDDHVITSSRDGTVRRWDAETGRELARRRAHERWITKLRAAGPHAFVTASEDGTLAMWDARTMDLRWRASVGGYSRPIWGLDASTDGDLVLNGDAGGIPMLRRGSDGSLVHAFAPAPLAHRACAISPDSRLAALGCDDGSLTVVQLDTIDHRWRSPGSAKGVLCTVARDDRRFIAIGHANGHIEVRDEEHGSRRETKAHRRFVYLLRPIDDRRFASGGFDGVVAVWDYTSGARLTEFVHGALVFGTEVCRSAQRLVTSGGDATRVWHLETGRAVAALPIDSEGVHNFVCASPTADTIVAGNEAGLLDVWRLHDTYRKERTIDLALRHDELCALSMAHDPSTLVAATAGGTVVVADLRRGDVRATHACHEDWIRTLHVTRNGHVLAVCQDTSFEILRLEDGVRLQTSVPKTRIGAAAQLDDGTLVTVALDGELRWQTPLGV